MLKATGLKGGSFHLVHGLANQSLCSSIASHEYQHEAHSSSSMKEVPVRAEDHALHRLGEHAAKLLDEYVGQLLAQLILIESADKHPVGTFVAGPAQHGVH